MEGRDPEMLERAIMGAEIKPCRASKQSAPSRLSRMVGSRTCLDLATFGPAMLFSGAMSADCFTLVFVRTCPTLGRSMNFGAEHLDGYMGFFPPGGFLDAVTPAGYGNASLTIPVEHFHAALTTAFPEMPEKILKQGAAMRVGPGEQSRLQALLTVCEALVWQPGEARVDFLVRQHLERELLGAFLAALRSGCSDLVPGTAPRRAARQRRLRTAREFLDAHVHEPIYLEDLCVVLGLSERGVENLFRDLLGMNPLVYLKYQRLHGVRRALLQAAPGSGVVKRAAYEWGFLHHGRFARDYRTLFGESPVETLAHR